MVQRPISKTAERAMKMWTAKLSSSERLDELAERKESLPKHGPYIVISREAGLPTTQIARGVADQLAWDALDHELLDELAELYHAPIHLMELMDEQPARWLADILSQGIAHRNWSPQAFVHRVSKIIQLAGHHGNCVIVGRGAQYILPHENGLFVRLIGSQDYRTNYLAERGGLSTAAAEAKVRALDKRRSEFVRRYFHHDVNDVHQYDLVVNVEKLGLHEAVKVIVGAYASCRYQETI